MNPIVSGYLKDFRRRQELSDELSDSDAFEHFAAYCVLSAERLDQGDYADALTGDGEEGLDAVAIIVNGTLMGDPADVQEMAAKSSSLSVVYVFVQAKTSEKWNSGDALKFTRAVQGFFEGADIGSSAVVEAAREINRAVLEEAARLDDNPRLRALYVGSGDLAHAAQVEKHLAELAKGLQGLHIFSSIRCEVVDRARIQALYKAATSAASATIEFSSKVTLPAIEGVQQAYLGVLPATELLKLVCDQTRDEVLWSVFEENVRSYQGANTPVNAQIKETLVSSARERFAVLNNGVTIVTRELRVTGNSLTLIDYQIVNGAQTSNVLFDNRNILSPEADVLVPTRIIQTEDEELITAVVTATNSQTQVRLEELNSRALAERNVESYFAAQEPPGNLLYERRAKQYENNPKVVKARVVDRYTLVRATAAAFMDEPHLATGYGVQLMGRLSGAGKVATGATITGRRLFFLDSDEPVVYYAAASAHYRLDLFLKTGKLDTKLKPARWHILMAARHIAMGSGTPDFGDRKIREWVKPFVSAVWDDARALKLFKEAADVVERTGLDLSRQALRNQGATTDVLRKLP